VRERDGAYHQGTTWPWLLGAFVDAWVWIHKRTPAAIHEARREYLQPLLDHVEQAGLGHVSEIADAQSPHTPRGCPWQAWSVGEALWLDRVVLAESARAPRIARTARRAPRTPALSVA
jgi:glycogen debranching enzyme